MTISEEVVNQIIDYSYGADNENAAMPRAFLITDDALVRILKEFGWIPQPGCSRKGWRLDGLPVVLTTDPPDPTTRR